MRKFLIILAALAFTISFAQAEEPTAKECDKAKTCSKAKAAFAVGGMTCGGCSGKVKRALAAIDGVEVDKVCHKSGTASVSYDADSVCTSKLMAAIKDTGFKLEGQKVSLDVDGMTCGGCSGKVKRALASLDGVSTAKVCHKSNHAEVTFDPETISSCKIKAAIADSGFTVKK